MRTKKSQIGSTLTWIAALVIIIFIMFLFSFASIGLAKTKDILGMKSLLNKDSSSGAGGPSKIELNQKLISFLETSYDEDMNFYDVVSKADTNYAGEEDVKKIYLVKVREFLENNFPMGSSGPYYYASLNIEKENEKREFVIPGGYFLPPLREITMASEGYGVKVLAQQEVIIYVYPDKRVRLGVSLK